MRKPARYIKIFWRFVNVGGTAFGKIPTVRTPEAKVYGRGGENETVQNREEAMRRVLSIDVLRGYDMLWITGGAGVLTALAKALPSRSGSNGINPRNLGLYDIKFLLGFV